MNLNTLVATHIKKLNENDLMIWSYISQNQELCSKSTIDQIAKNCNVSRTTVLRFTQKLSLSGFSEFKVYLKMATTSEAEINQDILENSVDHLCNDITQYLDKVRNINYDPIFDLIYNARNIYVYGTGAVQHNVAKELKRSFLSSQIFIFEIEGSADEVIVSTAGITKDDLIFIISLSGESTIALNFATNLKIKQVPIVSITKFKSNNLANLSNHNIYVNSLSLNISDIKTFETTSLFFLNIEILTLKYLVYLKNKDKDALQQNNGDTYNI